MPGRQSARLTECQVDGVPGRKSARLTECQLEKSARLPGNLAFKVPGWQVRERAGGLYWGGRLEVPYFWSGSEAAGKDGATLLDVLRYA